MAIIFIDGFDHYDDITEKWDARSGTIEPTLGNNTDVDNTIGRFTPGSLRVKNNVFGANSVIKNYPITEEVIIGFAWNNINSDSLIHSFAMENTAGDMQATFEIDAATGVGTLTSEAVSVVTAGGVFTGGVWQYIELRLKRSATVGELEIRRNTLVVASGTALDTLGTSTTGYETFEVKSTAASQRHHIDDLYIADTTGPAPQNTFLGDTRVTALRPKANGLDNNFSPTGAATNWEAVGETVSDGETSFVESGLIGAQEEYDNKSFDDVGVTPGTIYSAQVVNNVRKTDAGTIKYKDQMIIAGVEFDDVEVVATSGDFRMTTFIRDTDPSDSAAWTEAKIAAVGSGIEITFKEV